MIYSSMLFGGLLERKIRVAWLDGICYKEQYSAAGSIRSISIRDRKKRKEKRKKEVKQPKLHWAVTRQCVCFVCVCEGVQIYLVIYFSPLLRALSQSVFFLVYVRACVYYLSPFSLTIYVDSCSGYEMKPRDSHTK